MSEPTVFIVDDDNAVLDSIAELLSSVGLRSATFRSARQFLDAVGPDQPGCLVLDVRMADMSGPALQELLNAMNWRLPIVFISAHGDIPVAIGTIKAGAVDFVQKPYREQQLLDSINEALRRDAVTRRSNKVNRGFADRITTLTAREREVVDQVAMGRSNKSIAQALGISYRTVELHRSHVLNKLGVHSVAELISLLNE